MPVAPKNTRSFASLVEVVAALRGPDGCPWDKEQTHSTLTQYAIEEAFELAEAIDSGDQKAIIEELGDLLLQVVLHSEIARQNGSFTLDDVIQSITEKMIRRHPHVFGDIKVSGSSDVLKNWIKIKDQEKAGKNRTEMVTTGLGSIPVNMPALIRAQKIGDKTVRRGFDWSTPAEVFNKVDEEISELRRAIEAHDVINEQEELGDVLFTVVQLARHLNFDAEQALRQSNRKFEVRFQKMCELVHQDDKNFSDLSIGELENYWKSAKDQLGRLLTPIK